MKLDNHSKNVCLIGILHIMGGVLFSLEPLGRVINIITSDENADLVSVDGPIFHLLSLGFYVLLAILAGLMIRGVVKQSHLLVAPFLTVSCLSLPALIIMFLMDKYQFYFCLDSLYSIGVQIMLLYPVYTLFVKLRSKSLKEKSLVEPYCAEHDKKIVEILTHKLSADV